jgi:endonuclease/exonuclease/phosphatase family metal-dependent hydrolase
VLCFVSTDTLLPSQFLGLGSFPSMNLIPMMNSHNAINYSDWSVLSFNVRGINAVVKGNGIRCVIRESNCDIICLQETKKESFVRADLRRLCPNSFDEFAFVPSIGNSGGLITVWNSSKLVGNIIFQNEYALSVEFFAISSEESWIITNVYAPCSPTGKIEFLHWFSNINMPSEKRWLIVGDFNLMRRPENRNSARGDINLMLSFNEAISQLDLLEIPLHGLSFTWSNKQREPLLQRLDWFFMSQEWSVCYPDTLATTLPRDILDHVPCLISFKSKVPKPKIFRFENFWLQLTSSWQFFKIHGRVCQAFWTKRRI